MAPIQSQPPMLCAAYGGMMDVEQAKDACARGGHEFNEVLKFARQYVYRCWPEIRFVAGRLQRDGIFFGRDLAQRQAEGT